jgi:hypothetical protein
MIGELRSVVLDAADIHGLAGFYQSLGEVVSTVVIPG